MSCGAKGKMEDIHIDEDRQLDYIRGLLNMEEQMDLFEAMLDMYDITGPGDYWLSRFTPEACKAFRLGMNGLSPIYPIRDEGGNLMGIVHRNPYPLERPKYRYPKGVPTSNYLFGYEKITKDTILLVEGAPDVIAAWEAGIEAVGSYGARLSDRQIALLGRLEPRQVVVAYDSDNAGRMGAREAVRGLLAAGIMAASVELTDYHDLADIPRHAREDVVSRLLDSKDTVDYLLSHG
jgi:5S rRNA maturation endonuclease (ribonuclease M5)